MIYCKKIFLVILGHDNLRNLKNIDSQIQNCYIAENGQPPASCPAGTERLAAQSMQLAKESDALIRYGRALRINVKKLDIWVHH